MSLAQAKYATPRFYMFLIAVLGISLLARVGYLKQRGHIDLDFFIIPWTNTVTSTGLFSAYMQNPVINYPPLYIAAASGITAIWHTLGYSSGGIRVGTVGQVNIWLIVAQKLIPLISELALIAVVTWMCWARQEYGRLRWILPLLLAVYPGLIATTAFWGQVDSLLTLPLVLCLLALQQGRWRWSWAIFAIALLIKAQAVVIAPLMLILTLRRHGVRATVIGIVIAGVMGGVVMLPFIIGSGWAHATSPYFGAVGEFPFTTVNAFNVWQIGHLPNGLPFDSRAFRLSPDTIPILFGIRARWMGLGMLGIFTLLVMVNMWRRSSEKREFLWAAALYFGFFMLPTQIHERYLYPVAVLALIAMLEDRRMAWVGLPLIFTYTYNLIMMTDAPFIYLRVDAVALLGNIGWWVALINCVLFAVMIGILITYRRQTVTPSVEASADHSPILSGSG